MASKRFKKSNFKDKAQPQMQGPEPEEGLQSLDANKRGSPGLAGVSGRRRNNSLNPFVGKSESRIIDG